MTIEQIEIQISRLKRGLGILAQHGLTPDDVAYYILTQSLQEAVSLNQTLWAALTPDQREAKKEAYIKALGLSGPNGHHGNGMSLH